MVSLNDILANPDFIEAEYRRRFCYYAPHLKQELFHALGTKSRERLFLAGNRVGKTYAGSVEVAMHLTGIYPDWWQGQRYSHPVDAWAASDTNVSTRDILQLAYIGDPTRGIEGAIHSSLIHSSTPARGIAEFTDTVKVRHKSGGISTLSFKSYEQGRKKFQGTHKHVIHLDEEPPLDVYTECLLRTTEVGDRQAGSIILTMTPLSGMSELMKLFLVPEDGGLAATGVIQESGRVFVQAGWEDNPHISEAEREALFKKTPVHELEARQRGVPALGSGVVFPVAESVIKTEPFEIPKYWPRVYGMDFGWTNPTAAVFAAFDRENDIVYVYGEYVQSERTPQSHALSLMEMGADWMSGVCDPAGQQSDKADGQSLIDLYNRHGLNLTLAENGVEMGIQEMLERMREGRLKVFATCEKWFGEFRMYARDEKGRVKKINDHLMDATRYLVVSGLGQATTKREVEQRYSFEYRSAATL